MFSLPGLAPFVGEVTVHNTGNSNSQVLIRCLFAFVFTVMEHLSRTTYKNTNTQNKIQHPKRKENGEIVQWGYGLSETRGVM